MRESFAAPVRPSLQDVLVTTPYSEGAFFRREERSLCLVLRDYVTRMNIQLVLIEISALPRDHREHVLPDVLGDPLRQYSGVMPRLAGFSLIT